jgi:drug/metabolite transporter (DMT)-like permease
MSPSASRRAQMALLLMPVLALVFNAFTWGVSWWPFRQMQALGLHPLWATALIYTLVAVVLAAWRPTALRDVLRTPALWVLVLASGSTNAAFNWGVTSGDVMRVVLLFYLMPLWALMLARWLLHEPLRPGAVLRAALALGGAMVILWPADGGWPLPHRLADWLGLIGGIAFALNNTMLRREARREASSRALAMFVGGAVIGTSTALAGATVGVALPAWGQATAWIAWVSLLAVWFVVSNLALQFGAARLRSGTTAVVMVSEVLFASVSAVWLGAASLQASTLWGGALIAAAALLAGWQEARRGGG